MPRKIFLILNFCSGFGSVVKIIVLIAVGDCDKNLSIVSNRRPKVLNAVSDSGKKC
jgi:hypothetical protein